MKTLPVKLRENLRGALLLLVVVLLVSIVAEFGLLVWTDARVTNARSAMEGELAEYVAALEMEINAREREISLLYWLRTGDEFHLRRREDSQDDFANALTQYRVGAANQPEELRWADSLAALSAQGTELAEHLVTLQRRENSDLSELETLFLRIDNLLGETIQPSRPGDLKWQKVADEIKTNLQGVLLGVTGYVTMADSTARSKYEDSRNDLAKHVTKFQGLAASPDELVWADVLKELIGQVGTLSGGILALHDEKETCFAEYVATLHAISEDFLDERLQIKAERDFGETSADMERAIARSWMVGWIVGGLAFVLGIVGGLWLYREVISAHEHARQFQSLAQNAPFSVWMCDREGTITFANRAALNLFGVTDSTQIIGRHNIYRDSTEAEKPLLANFDRAWAGEAVRYLQTLDMTTVKYATSIQETLHINTTVFPLPAAGGQAPLLTVVQENVSDKVRAEKEREKLQAQLIQAQKMESVGRLAGGVAHDFNNMLSVIIGYTEMAMDDVAPDKPLHDDLEEVLNAAKRSAEITGQLLAFARKQTISPKVLDLNQVVESMLRILRRLIGEDIDLVWVPGDQLWSVKMDPAQIDQILTNLCVNARDAITGVGKVTIETSTVIFDEAYCADHAGSVPGEFVLLVVSDDGCGMDKEILDFIFEPFFTNKGVGQGTGLGMATVYGIVKQNNGFINVYSEPGKGTTVRVYLSRHVGEAEIIEAKGVSEIPLGKGETLLLVEDEPGIGRMCKVMLEKLGYRVLTAGLPSEAVRLAGEHVGEINLLITDVVMPEMNGRDLSNHLRTLYPEIKTLFMSGYTANVIAHRGVLVDGTYFIQKPFSLEILANKVREALERG